MIVHAAPWVVPMAAPPVRDGAVALDGDRVAAVGPLSQLRALGAVVEHGGVLLPGLVNAHLHLELSHLRVPGGDGLVPWIERLMAARARVASDGAAVTQAAREAALAMAARGTVAAVDISNDGGSASLLADAGIEPHVLHERIAPRGEPAPSALRGLVETAHATYSCGETALRALAARNGGRLASIHVEEDPAEADWLLDGSGPLAGFLGRRDALPAAPPRLRPVPWLESLGVLGAGTLLVHLTVADADSLARAARHGCVAVLCPRSNLHIGGRLPPVDGVRAAGLRVALGTDSLASCATLDVLGDVQQLARAGVDPAWLLRAATVGGGDAIGSPHLGALSVGKRPGLIAIGDDGHGLREPLAWLAHEGADAPARRIA